MGKGLTSDISSTAQVTKMTNLEPIQIRKKLRIQTCTIYSYGLTDTMNAKYIDLLDKNIASFHSKTVVIDGNV